MFYCYTCEYQCENIHFLTDKLLSSKEQRKFMNSPVWLVTVIMGWFIKSMFERNILYYKYSYTARKQRSLYLVKTIDLQQTILSKFVSAMYYKIIAYCWVKYLFWKFLLVLRKLIGFSGSLNCTPRIVGDTSSGQMSGLFRHVGSKSVSQQKFISRDFTANDNDLEQDLFHNCIIFCVYPYISTIFCILLCHYLLKYTCDFIYRKYKV